MTFLSKSSKYDANKIDFKYLSKLGHQLGVKLCPCCGSILEYLLEPELHVYHDDIFVCVNESCRACVDGALFE